MRLSSTLFFIAALPLLSAATPASQTQYYNFNVLVNRGQPHQNLDGYTIVPDQNTKGVGIAVALDSQDVSTVASFSFSGLLFQDVANLNNPKKNAKFTSQMYLETPAYAHGSHINTAVNLRSVGPPSSKAITGGFGLSKNDRLINHYADFAGWLICDIHGKGNYVLSWRSKKQTEEFSSNCTVIDLIAFLESPK